MGIVVVQSSTAASATPTMPAGAVSGDLIVVFAYNGTTVTVPTLPASWTNLTSQAAAATVAGRVAQRVYDGVWTMPAFTNATRCHAIALRGASATLGAVGQATANNATITWAALTTLVTDGSSLVLRGAVHARPDIVIPTPTNHTLVQAEGTLPGTGTFYIVGASPGAATSVTSRAMDYVALQAEIRAVPIPKQPRVVRQAVNRSVMF